MRNFQLELGTVSDFVTVSNHIIRYAPGPTSEIDEQDLSGFEAQGHIKNEHNGGLEKLRLDVAYYDQSGAFVGLDKSSTLFDDDWMERDETKAFAINLNIPD
jgi:hypothetical protein